MDAIKFLLSEHKRFRKSLKNIAKISRRTARPKSFMTFVKDLVRHEKMEQKIWYPYLKKNTSLQTVIKHLLSEEKTAAKAITKLKKINHLEKWQDKFPDFKKDMEHHAGEEEKHLFPKVKKELSKQKLALLGNKMQVFKKSH